MDNPSQPASQATSQPAAAPVLHHTLVTAPGALPTRWMFGLHGIFGMGRNWYSFAQQLTQARPEWGVALVDLRLHGHSQGFTPPHTLEAAAADLQALADKLKLPVRAIFGHSFGGKVALVYARDFGQQLEQVWVMDSTPEPFRTATSPEQVLAFIRDLPMPMPSRNAVIKALQERGLSAPVAQWLGTNLEHRDGQFHWRFDFAGLEQLLQSFYQADLWGVVEHPPFHTALHFVKAERSGVLSAEGCERIEAAGRRNGRVFLHILEDSDHWVHVDNPAALLTLVAEAL